MDANPADPSALQRQSSIEKRIILSVLGPYPVQCPESDNVLNTRVATLVYARTARSGESSP